MMSGFGPAPQDVARAALHDVVLPGELARLFVVDDEDVDALQHRAERLGLARRSRSSWCRRRRACGSSTCSRTSSCSAGWMLPRRTYGASRYAAGSFGRKSAKTLSCVSSVVAARRGRRRSGPRQRNVLPGARSTPSVSTPRLVKSLERAPSGSRRRRRATRRTGAKIEAAIAEYVADAAEDVLARAGGHLEVVEGERADDEDGVALLRS